MISIVGIGPSRENISVKAIETIKKAEVIIAYKGYVKPIQDLLDGKEVIKKGMGDEIRRAELAINKSLQGKKVALISSGDPGIFGMGNVLFQLIGKYEGLSVEVVPGITAANFAASLLGAPLHDFTVISLSDILTPLSEIKRKVEHACKGDFVIVFYNPLSNTRKKPFNEAYNILMKYKKLSTPVGIVRSVDGASEVEITSLGNLINQEINMSTTLIVGNSMTYVKEGYMITPRGYVVPSRIHPLASEFYEKFLKGEITEGENLECEYYPCHQHPQNCTFCYCPFYPCGDGSTGGKWIKDKKVWSCEDCLWIHDNRTVKCILPKLNKILKETDDLKNRKKELLKLRRECIHNTYNK
ncbi:MAG: precorrin-3B C(17)-methyltransferase [Methanobacteriaceae archaeon]